MLLSKAKEANERSSFLLFKLNKSVLLLGIVMKIDQLLELKGRGKAKSTPVQAPTYSQRTGFDPKTMQNTTAPLPKGALGGIPNVNATVPQFKTQAQPTTMASTPVSKAPTSTPNVADTGAANAGASAFGQMANNLTQKPATAPTTTPVTQKAPDEVDALKKNAGLPATQEPQQFQAEPAHPDSTLAQPLEPEEPADPNKPGLATRLGQGLGTLAKGAGALASIPQGVGRAFKKGYNKGVDTIGGPGVGGAVNQLKAVAGAGPRTGGATTGVGGAGGGDELAQLQATLQQMDQRLRRGGL